MYGITESDRQRIDKKIEYQKEYLKNFSIDIGDKKINMLNSTYSANLNPKKYFSEINNRVNSIFNYAKDKGLKPVFVTLTAPSHYHKKYDDGNYSIDPNDTAKDLTQIWNKFTRLKLFTRMKKETGHNLVYFRVYEPHKSGVPHLHAMLFLPVNYILPVKKRFKKYFADFGTNKNAMDFRYTWYKEAGGAVAYIMKYITKTFKDDNKKSVDDSVYWYVKHKVRRFLSSRTLLPLFVYRKIRHLYKDTDSDLIKLSEKYYQNQIHRLFEDTCISIVEFNPETEEIEDRILWKKLIQDKPSEDFETPYRVEHKLSMRKDKKVENKNIKVEINGLLRYSIDKDTGELIKVPVSPSKLSDLKLFNYLKEIENNIENTNLQHYGVVKNECIKRNIIQDELISLNHYKCDFSEI